MAILRTKELRKMNTKEVSEKEADLSKELIKLRSQVSGGTPPENPGRVRAIRRTLARIITIKKEKEVQGKE